MKEFLLSHLLNEFSLKMIWKNLFHKQPNFWILIGIDFQFFFSKLTPQGNFYKIQLFLKLCRLPFFVSVWNFQTRKKVNPSKLVKNTHVNKCTKLQPNLQEIIDTQTFRYSLSDSSSTEIQNFKIRFLKRKKILQNLDIDFHGSVKEKSRAE